MADQQALAPWLAHSGSSRGGSSALGSSAQQPFLQPQALPQHSLATLANLFHLSSVISHTVIHCLSHSNLYSHNHNIPLSLSLVH